MLLLRREFGWGTNAAGNLWAKGSRRCGPGGMPGGRMG